MCVCPALKRYPRFTGTRDPDPVRLLKKLRDRKGLRYVENENMCVSASGMKQEFIACAL